MHAATSKVEKIIEGNTEKELQCIIQLKSIYNKNLDFIKQKMDFLTLQRGSNKIKYIKLHSFCDDNFFLMNFFQRLTSVSHKDALFHSNLEKNYEKMSFQR